MVRLPELTEEQTENLITTTFLGYNHNHIINDGEMYDMKNLSGDQYPLLSQRRKRRELSVGSDDTVRLNGLHGRDQLFFIRGTECWWALRKINGMTVSDDPDMLPKKIVSMGAYICIWPDKMYFNTAAEDGTPEFGDMQRLWDTDGANVQLSMCTADGSAISAIPSETAPDSKTPGMYWIDTSGERHILKMWNATTASWESVVTTYVKIAATNVNVGLQQYDAIWLSGLTAPETQGDPPAPVPEPVKKQVEALNGSYLVYALGAGYIIVAGMLDQAITCKTGITVRADRKVPDLDYVCESNNRIWGCRYGMINGQVVNEIKACALGDFRNWDRYMGVSTDSYTASVGSDGIFTAAVAQKGYPVFFKENFIHRISGSTPSSFAINTTVGRGVQPGSWQSAVCVNESIYYKSVADVMVYDGSQPVGVSAPLGNEFYSNARAGAYDGKYYICMRDSAGKYVLFVYDTKKGLWYKEDEIDLQYFGTAGVSGTDAIGSELYAIRTTETVDPEDEQQKIKHTMLMKMFGSGEGTEESDLDWEADFGLFGADYAAQKYLSRFNIRMHMTEGSAVRLWILYDNDEEWRFEGEIEGKHDRTIMIPVIPRRCDHLRFKLTGHGSVQVYSIARVLEVGGDG